MDATSLKKDHKQYLWPLAIVLLIVWGTVSWGCFKKKPAPPPEPARLVLMIDAGGDINPNSKGLPSPVTLRIYQLKSFKAFQRADFLALYYEDDGILGKEMNSKQVITLIPNEKKTIFIEPDQAVRAIGLFAGFREHGESQWKAVTGVIPHKFKKININITGNRLVIH